MAKRSTVLDRCLRGAAGGALMWMCAFHAQALEGLKPSPDAWPRWQARLAVTAPALGQPGSPTSVQLAGDHYFPSSALGDGGGLRATGALLWGPRTLSLPASQGGAIIRGPAWLGSSGLPGGEAADASAAGYLGIGYSSWWLQSGLGISADLGLISWRSVPGLRLGGRPAAAGVELSDGSWRALQWTPVFQVALSYSF